MILKTCHHQLMHHSLNLIRGSWKSEAAVSHFGPTCNPEETADQNAEERADQKCHVQEVKICYLSPVLSSVN
jgi:hypothetical protein